MKEIDLEQNLKQVNKSSAESNQTGQQEPEAKAQTKDFEAQMRELEKIVAKLESGELNLEDSIKYFERGHAISQDCHKILQEMEERIRLLDLDNPEREVEFEI
ncbi:MAG: exodeoxyribonuclease VII small subunit [Eubacteriales bacterium]|nr:exodeoxyribonuclease VII small subunit [Eubacteriales bacterium]